MAKIFKRSTIDLIAKATQAVQADLDAHNGSWDEEDENAEKEQAAYSDAYNIYDTLLEVEMGAEDYAAD